MVHQFSIRKWKLTTVHSVFLSLTGFGMNSLDGDSDVARRKYAMFTTQNE